MKIFTRYLNSAAFYDRENESGSAASEKSEAEKQREAISVEVGSVSEQEAETKENENDSGKDEEEKEEVDSENEDEDKDEDDKQLENETEEQKRQRIELAKQQRKEDRQQKRINKAIAEAKAAKDELERLKQQLSEKTVEGLTEEEVERRAEAKAAEKLQAKQLADAQANFEKTCDALAEGAAKLNKQFDTEVHAMAEEIGPIPRPLIYILNDLDNKNGSEVLNYLVKNVDEAEEIYNLSESRMTLKLLRISDKLKDEKKLRTKKPALPDPIEPINGSRAVSATLTGTESTEDFIRIRERQIEDRRKARGY